MRSVIVIIVLVFAGPTFKLNAQRIYSYCHHVYCHSLHLYQVTYSYFTPGLVALVVNETSANPYLRLTCPTTNKLARKFYWIGYDSLEHYRRKAKFGSGKNYQEDQMKMAMIYFTGAIENDSTFCDAYDNLIDCYFLTQRYDSALRAVDRQSNPSFHSSLAKGVIYYEINKDYPKAEQYFQELCKKSPTAIYYYYLANAQIKLGKLDEAKRNVTEMETTLKAWDDGWAMMEKNMLVSGVIACKEKDYDKAYKLLDRIKKEYNDDPTYCHYYGITLQNKTDPSKGKGEKFTERAEKLKYNPDSML